MYQVAFEIVGACQGGSGDRLLEDPLLAVYL